jgi:hypothetical protein
MLPGLAIPSKRAANIDAVAHQVAVALLDHIAEMDCATWVRRCRDIIAAHLSDMGGADNTSAAERSLIRRASKPLAPGLAAARRSRVRLLIRARSFCARAAKR